MTKEQELLRDKSNELEEKKAHKAKIVALLTSHRSKDLPSLTAEEKAAIVKDIDTAEPQLRQIEIDIAKLTGELSGIQSAQGLKGESHKMIIGENVTMTREDRALAAGLGVAKIMMSHYSRGKVNYKLNEIETREVLRYNKPENIMKFTDSKIDLREDYAAITTTSEEFIAATAETLGINNGGVFIDVETLYDLLKIKARPSVIFDGVRKISVAARLKFPYSVGNTGADWYDELDCFDEEQIEFAYLELDRKGLGKYIRTTWELEAMTPTSFLTYLLQEVRNETDKSKFLSVIYGRGTEHTAPDASGRTRKRPQPYGIAYQHPTNKKGVSSVKKIIGAGRDYETAFDAVERAPLDLYKLNEDALEGAKFYVSMQFYEEFRNAKDPQGVRIFPLALSPTLAGQWSIEIDNRLRGKDFIFGNLDNYLFNTILPIALYSDKVIKCRTNEYGAFGMFDGMGFPDSFIFGTDSETPRDSVPTDVAKFRQRVKDKAAAQE